MNFCFRGDTPKQSVWNKFEVTVNEQPTLFTEFNLSEIWTNDQASTECDFKIGNSLLEPTDSNQSQPGALRLEDSLNDIKIKCTVDEFFTRHFETPLKEETETLDNDNVNVYFSSLHSSPRSMSPQVNPLNKMQQVGA